MSGARSGAPTLSMRERAEVDTIFARVRQGEHYEVLGVTSEAAPETVQKSWLRLTRWLDALQHPDRDLGDYRSRVEAVAAAVENAFRIVGNPRERMLYDAHRGGRPPATPAGATARGRGGAGRERASVVPPLPSASAGGAGEAPWRGSDGAPVPGERITAVSVRLVDLLEAHLAAALGRDVSFREAAGGAINLGESVRYARRAEEAEHAGNWADAAIQWHLAALAAPDDSTMVLRAATALRWAGASGKIFERYTRLVRDQDLLAPLGASPGGSLGASPETPAGAPLPRPPSRRPSRR